MLLQGAQNQNLLFQLNINSQLQYKIKIFMNSFSAFSSNSTVSIMAEQQFQQRFESQYGMVKSFVESFEDFKSTIKKLSSAVNTFSTSLSDIGKREHQPQSDSLLDQIIGPFTTFVSNFANNIKTVGQLLTTQLEMAKSRAELLKEFKVLMKKNFEDQNKQYAKLKKEYSTSKEKADDLKQKINEFKKMNDQRDHQQYIILKHDYQYASQEVKTRQKNKNDCNVAFQNFLLFQINQKDQLVSQCVNECTTKIEDLYKCLHNQITLSLKKYESFLLPILRDATQRACDQSNRSMMKMKEHDQSMDVQSIPFVEGKRYSHHTTIFSENILNDLSNMEKRKDSQSRQKYQNQGSQRNADVSQDSQGEFFLKKTSSSSPFANSTSKHKSVHSFERGNLKYSSQNSIKDVSSLKNLRRPQ